ncbi:MAG TPA: hypothetical protein VGW78_01355 [Candidatus Babeliales bacterium]|jgi:uncharacterized protein HemX|nr:hypothetical protein [Candidatus Babeliales bacterium]
MFHQTINNKYAMRWFLIISVCITSVNTQAIQWPTIWSGQNNKTILCSFGVLLAGMGIGGFIVFIFANKRLKANNNEWTQSYTKLLNEKRKLEEDNTMLQKENDEYFQEILQKQKEQTDKIKEENKRIEEGLDTKKKIEKLFEL